MKDRDDSATDRPPTSSMTRARAFWLLSTPGLVWAWGIAWAQSTSNAWSPEDGQLSLPVRVAIASSNWTIRLLPFAVMVLVLVWPLIVLGIERLTRSSHASSTRRDVLFWWLVSGLIVAMVFAYGAGAYFLGIGIESIFLAWLMWPAVVAFWVSLAAAYSIQRSRRLAHAGAWDPNWVLAAVAALNCLGVFVVPLLAALALGNDDSVESKTG